MFVFIHIWEWKITVTEMQLRESSTVTVKPPKGESVNWDMRLLEPSHVQPVRTIVEQAKEIDDI